MPQMAPLGWLSLFILFTSIFIMFCALNYFSYLTPAPEPASFNKMFYAPMNWKW